MYVLYVLYVDRCLSLVGTTIRLCFPSENVWRNVIDDPTAP